MKFPEIACRTRQEVWKWWDRFSPSLRRGARDPLLDAVREGLGNGAGAAQVRQNGARPGAGFFTGVEEGGAAPLLAGLLPKERERLLIAAEAIHERRFDLLGYGNLFFGNPIDWRLDPISGRRAPVAHWSKLDPLDPATVGDSKVVWELNRHQWFVRLGQAYLLTGEERHARLFAQTLNDWIEANPTGMGINWASSLEAAFRIIAWSWALFLFRSSTVFRNGLVSALVEGIRAHANHVEKYLSYYFSPNTHLTGEALGLFYAGMIFPELGGARRWRNLGEEILVREIERQVHSDGVYFEQATAYQRYTIEIYLHYFMLAKRNGFAVPEAVRERIQKMIDFLIAVRRPDGSVPQIGDADGGWLLPLAPRAPEDLRGLFAVAAAVFGRRDYAWAAGGAAPELFWFLGEPGLKEFESLSPAPPEANASRIFPEGGYAIMRSGWEESGNHVIFDFGPLGSPPTGGHGHADLLSLQCSAFGEPYIVDPGTYCYTPVPEWRDFFRGAAAHSSVIVDGMAPVTPDGPFHWPSLPKPRLRRWASTESYDLADAEHDAYVHLPDPVRHRRRILFVKPSCWIVVDDLYGEAEHRFELQLQFAPLAVALEEDGWARARGKTGHGLLVKAFSRASLEAEIISGGRSPIRGWVSADYGRREPAPLLRYTARARFPARCVTVIFPIEDPSLPCPEVRMINDGPSFPRGVVLASGKTVRFLDDGIVIEDARCLFSAVPLKRRLDG